MTKYNVNAKPFVPSDTHLETIRRENELFDALEKQFVESNKWLFEDDKKWMEFEYNSEKKFNEETLRAPPPTPRSCTPKKRKLDDVYEQPEDNRKETKEDNARPSYADIVKNK